MVYPLCIEIKVKDFLKIPLICLRKSFTTFEQKKISTCIFHFWNQQKSLYNDDLIQYLSMLLNTLQGDTQSGRGGGGPGGDQSMSQGSSI